MGVVWEQFSEFNVIVVSSAEDIAKVAVGLVDLSELLFGFGVTGVRARVVFYGELPVGFLQIGETGRFRHAQHLVEVGPSIGVVLLEELLFFFLLDTILLKELLEELVCVVHGELMSFDLVVVMALSSIRQSRIGLVDLIKLPLSLDSILWVLLGMPLGSQSLVGLLDVLVGGFLVESESVVEVLLVSLVGTASGFST